MQETTINVKIANRAYPITTDAAAEDSLRKASQLVNQMLDQLKNNYAVRDLQDLLAMCCLELAHHKVRNSADTNPGNPAVETPAAPAVDSAATAELQGELNAIERRIAEYLAG